MKRGFIKHFQISLFFFGIFYACEYNNRDEMFPELSYSCDLLRNEYSNNILSIIEAKCIGCHQNPSPSGNVSFESYETVADIIKYGSLIDRITRNPSETGFMPKSGSALSSEDLEAFITFKEMICP
jgi:hypothetical protein